MDARKSPRKPVLTHSNVVVIDGVEYAVATDTIKPVARERKLVKLDSHDHQVLRKSYKPKRDAFAFPDHSDDGDDFHEHEEHEKEHSVPLSIMKAQGSVQESDAFDGADDDDDVDMVKQDDDEAVLAAEQDDDMLLTQLSAFQTQDTEEGDPLETQEQERKIKPRAASTLPIVFGEKINRTKALLECEGDAVDLSGDMGAVGRFTVDHRDNDILLDLKGIIYKTTIVPSNTFMVVNVGQTEAKVEAIMSDFVQLREDTKFNENETMVEGTLQGFAFDSDEELERPAVEKAGSPEKINDEEGADDEKGIKKKKLPAKAPKSGKTPAKKAVAGKSKVGGKAKVKVGKKPTAKATKTKGKK